MNGYYYSVNDYYKELFGHKVYKISLNAGMSCPNRDGRIGTGGCIFAVKEAPVISPPLLCCLLKIR